MEGVLVHFNVICQNVNLITIFLFVCFFVNNYCSPEDCDKAYEIIRGILVKENFPTEPPAPAPVVVEEEASVEASEADDEPVATNKPRVITSLFF